MRPTLITLLITTALLSPGPAPGAGPDLGLTDSLMLIFGSPRVEPESQGHMISHWGYFEGPGMRAGDWALADTLPTDRFVQLNTHGPILPHQLAKMTALANEVSDARFNVLTSCYGGNKWYFAGTSDASAVARMTGRPTVAFRGAVAVWADANGTTNVLVERVPHLKFTRPAVNKMASVHYPDGRVKILPHPERLFRGAILQPGPRQVTSARGAGRLAGYARMAGSKSRNAMLSVGDTIRGVPGGRLTTLVGAGFLIDYGIRKAVYAAGGNQGAAEFSSLIGGTAGVAAVEHYVFGASWMEAFGTTAVAKGSFRYAGAFKGTSAAGLGAVIAAGIHLNMLAYEINRGIYARINEPGFNGFTPEERDAWLAHPSRGWQYAKDATAGYLRALGRTYGDMLGLR